MRFRHWQRPDPTRAARSLRLADRRADAADPRDLHSGSLDRRRPHRVLGPLPLWGAALVAVTLSTGCQTPGEYRREADDEASRIIAGKQRETLGQSEPFTIERPADALRARLLLRQDLPYTGPVSLGTGELLPIDHWPADDYLERARTPAGDDEGPKLPSTGSLPLSLMDALQVAAGNSRAYQGQKEAVYRTALRLDLERDAFRNTFAAIGEILASVDLEGPESEDDAGSIGGVQASASGSLARLFKTGASFTARLGLDLVKLLTQDRLFTRGLFADATIAIPLLRGSERHVVAEPLTQAEREVTYAIYELERFKRLLAVEVASAYLGVLRQLDQVRNEEANYRSLIGSARRARRLADAGRLPEIQVDQARQDELRARNRWISAREAYQRRLDELKVLLGLPTDAAIELDGGELDRLKDRLEPVMGVAGIALEEARAEPPADGPIVVPAPTREGAGPLELPEEQAVELAIRHRLDLRVTVGRVHDSMRKIVVAADALRADLTLLGTAAVGGRRAIALAVLPDAELRPQDGRYSALLGIDLPFERTAERNLYRDSFIVLEEAVRAVQALEDEIKLEVRSGLRSLLEARESLRIQSQAVQVATRRVASTDLFLQAGRAAIRDVLEAQESLIAAQNSLTAALVQYRIAELELQRDLGVLVVDDTGLWKEFGPGRPQP